MKRHHQSALFSLLNRRGQMSTTAIVFIILGICFVVGIVLLALVVALMLPAVQQARAAAQRAQSTNNLKQIGLALHNYHDVYNMAPPGGIYTADNTPYNSWMTSLLPYIEQSQTYNQIDFNEPWSSPRNQAIFTTPIMNYLQPAAPAQSLSVGQLAAAHYAANSKLLLDNKGFKFREITDGTSNVIAAGEVNSNFMAWGDPANRRDPSAGIGSGPGQFGSLTSGQNGANILMADGSVRFISVEVSPDVMSRLADPADGQVVGEF
ncbi:MAG: DUF1559 domain-containing protein [Planctomyces sp.]|nr:DUF1559 domain-containing protein [Planctomyces sp.]